jgi:hypothetical protein
MSPFYSCFVITNHSMLANGFKLPASAQSCKSEDGKASAV